jgi:hypothetical protein
MAASRRGPEREWWACSNGHDIITPAGYDVGRCLVLVRGRRCKGTVTATGPGARRRNAERAGS